jgi:hypothetical protein
MVSRTPGCISFALVTSLHLYGACSADAHVGHPNTAGVTASIADRMPDACTLRNAQR